MVLNTYTDHQSSAVFMQDSKEFDDSANSGDDDGSGTINEELKLLSVTE